MSHDLYLPIGSIIDDHYIDFCLMSVHTVATSVELVMTKAAFQDSKNIKTQQKDEINIVNYGNKNNTIKKTFRIFMCISECVLAFPAPVWYWFL